MKTALSATSAMPRAGSLCLFLALACAVIAALQTSHAIFPGDRGLAVTGRALCTISAIGALVVGSRRLLARDGLPVDRLAIGFDVWHVRAFVIGVGIALLATPWSFDQCICAS